MAHFLNSSWALTAQEPVKVALRDGAFFTPADIIGWTAGITDALGTRAAGAGDGAAGSLVLPPAPTVVQALLPGAAEA